MSVFTPHKRRKITVLCIFQLSISRRQTRNKRSEQNDINSLHAKLNPICHLLALLEVHHIFHVSRLRVKHSPYKSALNVIVNANFVQKYLLSLIFYWSYFYVLKQDHTIQNCKMYEQVEIFIPELYETCFILQRG